MGFQFHQWNSPSLLDREPLEDRTSPEQLETCYFNVLPAFQGWPPLASPPLSLLSIRYRVCDASTAPPLNSETSAPMGRHIEDMVDGYSRSGHQGPSRRSSQGQGYSPSWLRLSSWLSPPPSPGPEESFLIILCGWAKAVRQENRDRFMCAWNRRDQRVVAAAPISLHLDGMRM